MADSNITKKAMAEAIKELMKTTPFNKISVGQICEQCHMNRKSFYYHFKDKQDLVNWIYQSEFISTIQGHDYETGWDFLSDICNYFYENRTFYRKALKIEGQNSFSDYFREMLEPLIHMYVTDILKNSEYEDFFVPFFTDALIGAIKRWIMYKECMEPDEFVGLFKSSIVSVVRAAAEQAKSKGKGE